MEAATRWRFSRVVPYRMVKRATLVNARIKWVKDPALDAVVSRERHLRPAVDLVHAICASATDGGGGCGREGVPVHEIPSRRRLGLPATVPSTTAFMRRHPAVFHESRPSPSSSSPSSARPFRWFGLTPEAAALRREEAAVMREMEVELVNRLRKLLMLAGAGALPLPVVDQLRWDLGLPLDYRVRFCPVTHTSSASSPPPPAWQAAAPRTSATGCASFSGIPAWPSHASRWTPAGRTRGPLAFQLSFTRGFGLKKKWVAWLEEWQRLPYTSPYDHAAIAMLDPRTDAAEKRVVALFHELLHLTVGKKTERANLSNLRGPLGLPFRFSKVFGRHPGVFYLSQKLATQTVVLREGYAGTELVEKHPLVEIRESYVALMRVGREDERDAGAGAFAGEAALNDSSSSPDDDGVAKNPRNATFCGVTGLSRACGDDELSTWHF
ncbi:unnamed protein product [Spirodela intermedia]|uniref:PORR domain-containing protein n=1 Tax=Spirodela intermedia TaxID=51605 RepID=A0A7I8IQ67_SPIIN|nr:unnamed protein product [Spirodela intermedia]CAA6659715.1 unnamed protein product [Spirodela intermedia]